MDTKKGVLDARDELNKAIAIADVLMSAFDGGEPPESESCCLVMGTLYEHLKKASEELQTVNQLLRGDQE